MLRRTRRLLSASLIASAACTAHAAELGDPRLASHIGQQLVADIELTSLEDANTPVQVRLASPEVYSEAGIAVPSVLSTLNLSVMRRDGRQFLHATTLRPVEADHLHLYLELVDHGQHEVRLATLWLTPDPHPAPVPAPVPLPVAAPAVAAPAAPAPAARPELRAPVPVSAPVRAHVESEPAPPPLAWARPSVPVPTPVPVHAAPAAKIAPPLPVPKLAPLPIHAPARPAACAPQSGEAEACIALGARNAELRSRIGQLEQRVKGLQASLGAGQGAKPAAAPPAPAAAKPPAQNVTKPPAQNAAMPAPQQADAPKPKPKPKPVPAQEVRPPPRPAGPMPISSIKPLLPHKTKTPPADGLPWGMIGGAAAVLAALGGGAALFRARGKRSRNVDIPDEPGMLPKLRERFFARNGGKAAIDPVGEPVAEPTLE